MTKIIIIVAALIAATTVALVVRSGFGDVWRKTLFYGGALSLLAFKAFGLFTILPWGAIPILALAGVFTETKSAN